MHLLIEVLLFLITKKSKRERGGGWEGWAFKDHVVQTEQTKNYGPVSLGNAAETLTKTVIFALSNKSC